MQHLDEHLIVLQVRGFRDFVRFKLECIRFNGTFRPLSERQLLVRGHRGGQRSVSEMRRRSRSSVSVKIVKSEARQSTESRDARNVAARFVKACVSHCEQSEYLYKPVKSRLLLAMHLLDNSRDDALIRCRRHIAQLILLASSDLA